MFNFINSHSNHIKCKRQVLFDELSFYPKDSQTQYLKNFLSGSISFYLLVMNWTIHFDDQSKSRCIKVNDKIADGLLTAKLYAIEFLST